MKRRTNSFLIVAVFTVIAGMAAQVNAASQEVQKQHLPSVKAQASASWLISLVLPKQAEILMKNGPKRDGIVVGIDAREQKLWIQGGMKKRSLPLSEIEKIVFLDTVAYRSHDSPIYRAGVPSTQAKWKDIPLSAFRGLDAELGEAEVKLKPPIVNQRQLREILEVAKYRQFVVDEMQFDLRQKTMTILATPY